MRSTGEDPPLQSWEATRKRGKTAHGRDSKSQGQSNNESIDLDSKNRPVSPPLSNKDAKNHEKSNTRQRSGPVKNYSPDTRD